ncbi:MAG TPA: DUF4350 domain-containing protein [Candidatus Xenobia bacterium]|nr:DUF4350 domain-containing protein [Candidatus Xenobia bacterium]
MPVPLEPGDRKVLIVAGALLVALVVVVVLTSPPPQEDSFYPSSYGTDSNGAKAAYLLLKDLGYAVERWEQSATELPAEPEGAVLVLAEPFVGPSTAERAALRQFVLRGGRVLATGPRARILIPAPDANPQQRSCEMRPKNYSARIPSPLTRDAPVITLAAPLCFEEPSGGALGVFGDGNRVVVVTYRLGSGQVTWWAGSTPLTNSGIRETGNLALLLNSLGPPEDTWVLWDEYYHGHQGSLVTYFRRTPLLWGLLQLGIVFAAVCFAYARRSGPVRPLEVESRLSPLEYVETVGDLYHRAHAAAAAVGVAYQRFRFLLTQQMGVPPRAGVEEVEQALTRRLGRRDPGLRATLERCQRASQRGDLKDEDALLLIQALHEYARQLLVRPAGRRTPAHG